MYTGKTPSLYTLKRPRRFMGESRHSCHVLQQNLCKATTECIGLSRQVVFHHRGDRHDFVKTSPGKIWTLCAFIQIVPVSFGNRHYIGM